MYYFEHLFHKGFKPYKKWSLCQITSALYLNWNHLSVSCSCFDVLEQVISILLFLCILSKVKTDKNKVKKLKAAFLGWQGKGTQRIFNCLSWKRSLKLWMRMICVFEHCWLKDWIILLVSAHVNSTWKWAYTK